MAPAAAPQPSSAFQPLGALNPSSGRFATFVSRPVEGRVTEYTYLRRRDNNQVTAHKFEVFLVGTKAEHYCMGFVKATAQRCSQAMQRFTATSI